MDNAAAALQGVPELYLQLLAELRRVGDLITAARASDAPHIVYAADAWYRTVAAMEEGAGKVLADAARLFMTHDRQRYADGWKDGRAALLAEQAAAAARPRLQLLAASG